jgi:hypothetical protein
VEITLGNLPRWSPMLATGRTRGLRHTSPCGGSCCYFEGGAGQLELHGDGGRGGLSSVATLLRVLGPFLRLPSCHPAPPPSCPSTSTPPRPPLRHPSMQGPSALDQAHHSRTSLVSSRSSVSTRARSGGRRSPSSTHSDPIR